MNEAMVMVEPGRGLVRERRPIPSCGPGEVVVRVRASSLNYHDVVNLRGLIRGPYPRVPMSDGAGDVAAVGEGVRWPAPGARVTGTFYPRWIQGPPVPEVKRVVPGDTGDGWLQQYVVADADAVVATPAHLDDVEAATLPCAAVTAWSALRAGEVTAGDVVVVQGTGGMALWAVQLAKAMSADVVLLSSSDAKLAAGRSLGADHLVNRMVDAEWHRRVREVTGGQGADLVIDVGGPDTLGESVRASRMGGTVAVVGALGGFGGAEVPVGPLMTRNVRLVGITVGSVADHRALARAVEATGLRPVLHRTVGWEEVDGAAAELAEGAHVGKIGVIIP